MDRIKDGFCCYKNPFGGQLLKVSLRPEDCLGIVFWTRYPAPLFKYLKEIEKMGFKFYFHYTITGYPKSFETHNPTLQRALYSFKKLSDMISSDYVFLRYDPLILSSITDSNYHLRFFESLCESLKGFTKRCYFSFVDYYSKTRKNLDILVKKANINFYMPTLKEQISLSRKLNDIGRSHDIRMYACCTDYLTGDGIYRAKCVDDEVFFKAGVNIQKRLKPKPTRKGCGCIESTDIGTYDSCLFGCKYCYGTRDREKAFMNFKKIRRQEF